MARRAHETDGGRRGDDRAVPVAAQRTIAGLVGIVVLFALLAGLVMWAKATTRRRWRRWPVRPSTQSCGWSPGWPASSPRRCPGRVSDMAAANEAFERWAYDEGWSAGLRAGRTRGFEEGYGAGFDAGRDLAAARLVASVEPALRDLLVQLVPELAAVSDPSTVQKGRCR